ncbi:MAG: methyltransferase domain-containing protein [Candidatus Parcubacteria bacterium]|nr:methyltransferase domain-containing protein [Candidatus Parcubacteria bacterium]
MTWKNKNGILSIMQFSNPDDNIREMRLTPGDKVVIFGSGSGGHTLAAARVLKSAGTIYGIDSRGQMVEKLKKEASEQHHMNVRVINGNVEKLGGTSLGPLTTDVVIIPDTFFSHSDKEGILKEADRILRPGGKMLVIDWIASFGGAGPQPEHVFSEEEALKLSKNAGFVYERRFSAGSYHYALIFHKPTGEEKKKREASNKQ